ncbi:MAG: aminotransferase class I/II-fold pyridoxal phosphate-dependent enzyme, partial [Kangiellaceae bacterium]
MQTVTKISHPQFPSDTHWDVEGVKAAGLYTWFKEISEELDNSWVVVDGKKMLMMGGYSYLGLNKNEAIEQAAMISIGRYGTGMSGSRFLAGSTSVHAEVERKVATLHNKDAAMLLTSGYLANVSTISALLKKGDYVICDKLNHASIMDGARYSEANFLRYRHNDPSHLKVILNKIPDNARKLVITDSVFSMCGEAADLPKIIHICKQFDAALMVDECHSMYVLGKTGGGIVEYFNLDPKAILRASITASHKEADLF